MSQPLSDDALDQLFRTARSYNGYLDKPVAAGQLHAIWDLLKFGPTSANMLPARLIWCVSRDAREKLAATATKANALKIQQAPVIVIIGTDMKFQDNIPWLFPPMPEIGEFFAGRPDHEVMALRNSSLQGAYFIMAVRALGLDAGPMSGFDNAAVDAEFFADAPNVKSNFISTLGYGDPSTISERLPRPDFDTFNTIV